MPKKKDYHLSDTELLQIREVIRKDKRPKVAQRATAIHMLHQGQKVADVAQTMAVSTITIYKWIERFREGGIDGLVNQPKGRPPCKADENYLKTLEIALVEIRVHMDTLSRSGPLSVCEITWKRRPGYICMSTI